MVVLFFVSPLMDLFHSIGLEMEEQPQGPPSKMAPKWVYLSHKIMTETSEPVLGLQYVDEILKETDPDGCEPKYSCNLCVVTGKRNLNFSF